MDVKSKLFFKSTKITELHLISLIVSKEKKKNKQASELMLHLSSFQESNGWTPMDLHPPLALWPHSRCSSPTHLVDGVQKIDTVLIPAQHPAFPEEAWNEPQVFLRRAATSPIRGLQTRVELKRCDSSSKDILEDKRGLNGPMDISLPQPEPRPGCIQG